MKKNKHKNWCPIKKGLLRFEICFIFFEFTICFSDLLLTVSLPIVTQETLERDLDEKRLFIQTSPFFSKWSYSMQRQLQWSLTRTTHTLGDHVIKQGEPVTGLHFLVRSGWSWMILFVQFVSITMTRHGDWSALRHLPFCITKETIVSKSMCMTVYLFVWEIVHLSIGLTVMHIQNWGFLGHVNCILSFDNL